MQIRVERLTPARRDDFLGFFDHERGPAFADNPGWAKCYCHFYHVPKAIAWPSLDAAANRTAMTARIEASEMDGFLAYADRDVVGWLNAQPLSKLPHCAARMGIAAAAAARAAARRGRDRLLRDRACVAAARRRARAARRARSHRSPRAAFASSTRSRSRPAPARRRPTTTTVPCRSSAKPGSRCWPSTRT